ncbi:hypothetical protein ACLKA7_005658 [Drosophila subpalustris]
MWSNSAGERHRVYALVFHRLRARHNATEWGLAGILPTDNGINSSSDHHGKNVVAGFLPGLAPTADGITLA